MEGFTITHDQIEDTINGRIINEYGQEFSKGNGAPIGVNRYANNDDYGDR